MEELVFLDGALVPRREARVSPLDHGFLYGYGLFETMHAGPSGRIFRLSQHMERLRGSAALLGIPLPALDLERACYDTLRANALAEARLRLTLTAGEGEPVPDIATCRAPTVVIIARPLRRLPPESYQAGHRAVLSSQTRNSRSLLSRVKSTCFVQSVLARREARLAGADEGLMCNEKGLLAEGGVSNVFLVEAGRVVTPSVEGGVLPGITRAAVIACAAVLGVPVEEREVAVAELTSADEAFLTNSVFNVMPLTRFEGSPVGAGRPGPVTERLMQEYLDLVRREAG